MNFSILLLTCSLLGLSIGHRIIRRSDNSSEEKDDSDVKEEKDVSIEEEENVSKEEVYHCKDLTRKVYHELNVICEDCYSLHNQPEVYTLCRTDCFSSHFFDDCADALLISDEVRTQMKTVLDNAKANNYRSSDRKKK